MTADSDRLGWLNVCRMIKVRLTPHKSTVAEPLSSSVGADSHKSKRKHPHADQKTTFLFDEMLMDAVCAVCGALQKLELGATRRASIVLSARRHAHCHCSRSAPSVAPCRDFECIALGLFSFVHSFSVIAVNDALDVAVCFSVIFSARPSCLCLCCFWRCRWRRLLLSRATILLCDSVNRDTLLKFTYKRWTKAFSIKIFAFLSNAKLFLSSIVVLWAFKNILFV